MSFNQTQSRIRVLSIIALIAACLGGVFYWWVPMGIVWGLGGFMLGLADWTRARRQSLDYRLSIVAMLIAVAALALDIFIYAEHLQRLTFGGS